MSAPSRPLATLESSYAHELEELCVPWEAARAPAPRLLALNDDLAAELGLEPDALRGPAGVAMLVGHAPPEGAVPVAQAYAGHQFGGYSPRLGDGRALLLGELLDVHGRRRDLHLKGSGRTPFARGGRRQGGGRPDAARVRDRRGDPRAGHPDDAGARGGRDRRGRGAGDDAAPARCSPGSRPATCASARSSTPRPSATLRSCGAWPTTRSHAITRARPARRAPYLALLERVVDAQASLVARWMLVGFVHGVMNTDNVTISGETIDYGPCAFMDAFDPATVFSSIDHGGRYAYGNQPAVAQWNLARLAESLLPLLGADTDAAVTAATGVLASFPARFRAAWDAGMRAKLGLVDETGEDQALVDDLLALLHDQRVDFTQGFRALSAFLRGDGASGAAAVRRARGLRGLGAALGGTALRPGARTVRGRGGDGRGQPGLHPAQPPGRGRAVGRHRGRPRAVRAPRGRPGPAVRRAPGPGALRDAGPGGRRLPHVLRDLSQPPAPSTP
jgi:hypothetical protein